MRVGAIVPNSGPLPERLGIAAMARAAEAAGAASLWVSDHLLMVDAETTDYPYSADGRPTWPVDADIYEALSCCAYLAGVTTRCRIGTAVLVLPQRPVLEVAKIAASIDRLSGGRLDLGVGAGWYAAEMTALGYDPRSRGRRLDEMLDALRDCWSGRPPARAGETISIPPGVVLHPRPVQAGGPPLLVGGMSDPALRRAARRGDGWLALAYVADLDVDRLGDRLAAVRELREATGRPLTATLKLHATPDEASELPSAADAIARLGFDELIVEAPWAAGLDAAAETIAVVSASVARTASC